MPETRKIVTCKYCHGTGSESYYEAHPEMYGENGAPVEFAVDCRVCKGKRATYREENESRLKLPFERTISYFNPNIYKDAQGNVIDFSNYYEFINNYINHYEDIVSEIDLNGLYIYSEVGGNGKTLLASIVCYELFIRYHMMPKCVTENEILEEIEKTVADAQISTRDQFRKAPVLFIDDMWRKKTGRDWTDDELFGIIDYRYTHKMPTIVTSNVPLSSPKIDTRIASRLNGMCVPIHIPDVEIRNKEKMEKRKDLLASFEKVMKGEKKENE